MAKLQPLLQNDFRQGRYTPTAVSNALVPVNSTSFSKNINYDTIVGSAVVRPGTTLLGSNILTPIAPFGLGVFVGRGGSPNVALAAYQATSGANHTNIYYNSNGGGWATSGLTSIGNFTVRFETLGNKAFLTSAYNGMYSSSDGNTWAGGSSNDCIDSATAKPTLLKRFDGRMLASGDATFRDRVYFSSIIAPGSSPFITWDPTDGTGDYIDVNPDDGGYVTGFSETSTFVLVFKSTGMYRMDTIAKTVTPENIYNVGAVSQESIVLCQGITYFFSGIDIRRTNGGFPEQISRAGVQDIVNAIPQANWSSVAAGTDGTNVYFSVGNVTINSNKDNQQTITNCVLKFSPRDQSWSVHSYAQNFQFFATYTDSTNGQKMIGADTAGNVQKFDVGTTDNGSNINFFLETQDIDFGARSHLKQISDKIVVFSQNAGGSAVQFRVDGNDVKDVPMQMDKRVNIGRDINLLGNFFNFVWYGDTAKQSPILEGFEIPDVTDTGINTNYV